MADQRNCSITQVEQIILFVFPFDDYENEESAAGYLYLFSRRRRQRREQNDNKRDDAAATRESERERERRRTGDGDDGGKRRKLRVMFRTNGDSQSTVICQQRTVESARKRKDQRCLLVRLLIGMDKYVIFHAWPMICRI
jgi:hypothetical protein